MVDDRLDNRWRWPTAMPGCPYCGNNDSGLYTDYSRWGDGCVCWRCESTFPEEDGITGVR